LAENNGMIKYVKFLRGTPKAFDKVPVKDLDTLYFISEKDATTGKLYLGEKLISGGQVGTLDELLKNSFEGTIVNGSTIVYNADADKWELKVTSESVSVMTGATEEKDGVSGLVPVPTAGENKLFLQGDGTWANPIKVYETDIKTLIDDSLSTNPETSSFVLKEVYTAEVGSLDDLISRTKEDSTIVDEINNIYERLTWGEIEEPSDDEE
jgi:hypothetical protein